MRIAIVNDMKIAIEGLRKVIASSPKNELAWVAENGEEAVQMARKDTPDLILMDIVMPVMDGVEATRQIMRESPCPILVVTSSIDGNASRVFDAMGAGALDVVKTPILGFDGEVDGDIALVGKILTIEKLTAGTRSQETSSKDGYSFRNSNNESLLVIGSSTGGPLALSSILGCLPEDFPASVIIIQHVDAHFAGELASWLDKQCVLPVKVALEGERIMKGKVYIASTNDHLTMTRFGKFSYSPEPRKLVYRPSVDVFFESVAAHWGGKLAAVLLTGMGRDGAMGLLTLRERGVYTIAQDKETCAVYGMPKAAAEINAAVDVLPLGMIGNAIVKFYMGDRGKQSSEVR